MSSSLRRAPVRPSAAKRLRRTSVRWLGATAVGAMIACQSPDAAVDVQPSSLTGENIHSLGSANGMLYSGEDVWLPKTGQCVVMGIGSTAFPKLLAQQGVDAKISVALGKLPWGFASNAGGPIALNAWEAVVWGDKT